MTQFRKINRLMDRRESDLSSFTRLKANRQIWADRSNRPAIRLFQPNLLLFFPFFFRGFGKKSIIYFPEIGERKKKRYIYTHIRPDKYSEKLGPRFDVWDTPCPDRGQLTKSMKRREVYNLSRGTNPLLSRYKHNRAIYTYRDGLHSKLIIDDTSRGWSIIKGLGSSRSMFTTRIARNCANWRIQMERAWSFRKERGIAHDFNPLRYLSKRMYNIITF